MGKKLMGRNVSYARRVSNGTLVNLASERQGLVDAVLVTYLWKDQRDLHAAHLDIAIDRK